MSELERCPHCGGKARLTGRDCRYAGTNGAGAKKIKYRIRAICNKCGATGKPILTEWFSTHEHNFWSFQRGGKDEFFGQYASEAIAAWNRRAPLPEPPK